MGEALRLSNVDLSSFKGAKCWEKHEDKIKHILRAQELANWIDKNPHVFGNKTDKKATEKAVIELLNSREQTVQGSEQEVAHLKSNNEQLLEQQIEQLKAQVEQLEKQLEYVKANEAWLKQQLDQKLIEHKNSEKKGLLSKLFG